MKARQVGFWTSVCPLGANVRLSKTEVHRLLNALCSQGVSATLRLVVGGKEQGQGRETREWGRGEKPLLRDPR